MQLDTIAAVAYLVVRTAAAASEVIAAPDLALV